MALGRTRIPTLMLKDVDNMITLYIIIYIYISIYIYIYIIIIIIIIIIYIYIHMNVLLVVEILLRMLPWTSENVLLIGCSRNNYGRIMHTIYAYITCMFVYLYL